MKQFADRVAVVTGAGSGIGRATSLLLAKRGCRLAVADLDRDAAYETKASIEKSGGHATAHAVDVSDRGRMQDFARDVVAAHGGVNLLVNNAGVGLVSTFQDQSLEDFEWLMGVNFWGVVHGCKSFLPALLAANEAQIVNVSSMFGLVGVALQTSYCASKFAVVGFSDSLRAELADTHVRVTTVIPGGVATNVAAKARFRGDDEARKRHDNTVRAMAAMMPPEKAAERIVAGIARERPRVLITTEARVIEWVGRAFPSSASAFVQWGLDRMNDGSMNTRDAKR